MEKYFDYAATALPFTDIYSHVLKDYSSESLFGNPSSIHLNGIFSKKLLEDSRQSILRTFKNNSQLSCDIEDSTLIFTSGGTESDNIAIFGTMLKYKPDEAEFITSRIEHPAVSKSADKLEKLGYKVHRVSVDKNGIINLKELKEYINKKTKLISIMAVNNEIGSKQPIMGISQIARENNILFHTDAVQSVGLYDFDLALVDLASFSGHKFGALKGTGFLYMNKKVAKDILNINYGGGQESNLKSGTENVYGAIIMQKCLHETIELWNKNRIMVNTYRKYLTEKIRANFKNYVLVNTGDNCVYNNINIAFKNIDSEQILFQLSNKGYCLSTGSACHSGNSEISDTIKALNIPEEYQKGVLRITLPYNVELKDIDLFYEELSTIIKKYI